MKIWIDLANSPHPLLFAPVARRLESEAIEVLVTARANAQTAELARAHWPHADVLGGESPRGKLAKVLAIRRRIATLRHWAEQRRPDVALSHNSYAQIVAARSLGIPVVTAMDFEHQPANHLAFRLARKVIVPEVFPVAHLRRQGARELKLVRYPGLKEELYIGDFEPDSRALERIGLSPRPHVVVVMRTPPSRAIYHPSSNPLFDDALRTICAQSGVACIVLARHPEQVAAVKALALPNCIVPEAAVDSRSIVYAADAMIGAGGTMTREAALMGVPTWTLFAGRPPSVDLWLERQGLLRRLERPQQLRELAPRVGQPRPLAELRWRSAAIEQALIDATIGAARTPSRRSRGRGTRSDPCISAESKT